MNMSVANNQGINFFGPQAVFDKVVAKYMAMYGFDLEIERTTEASEYDVETSRLIEVKEVIPARGMLFDLTLQSNGTSTFRSTLIEAGDKQLFIQPPSKRGQYQDVTTDAIVPGRDTITINGDSYDVVTFKEINPTTTNSTLWELYIRK